MLPRSPLSYFKVICILCGDELQNQNSGTQLLQNQLKVINGLEYVGTIFKFRKVIPTKMCKLIRRGQTFVSDQG